MARIPDDELARLKAGVSLVRLVQGSGVALTLRGGELVGLCPFHEDREPSFSVNPQKNLFHCFGCDVAGGPIDWVMKRQGVSFRHAVELLRDGASGEDLPSPQNPTIPPTPTRRLPAPVRLEADDQTLLNQVADYYHATLKQSPEALEYLKRRGLAHGQLIERFKLGYSNRTLGLRLPEKNRKAGAEMRARLTGLGIMRESGHEHFSGSLIVPILDERGDVRGVYGRKINEGLRKGTALHLYLPGAHKGVWNLDGLKAGRGEVILCEALIDAMTFWCAGYRNVTAAYGVNGFTEHHLNAFRAHDVEKVLIAYDRDPPGERAAESLAKRLMEAGLTCFRIEFPKTMDANTYAQRVAPASKSLGVLIRKASWLGKGKAPRLTSAPADELEAALAPLPADAPTMAELIATPEAAAKEEDLPEPTTASPVPEGARVDAIIAKNEQELQLALGDRRYRVRGWMRPLNPESMKVNLLVHRPESAEARAPEGRFHVDTLDLYNAKARAAYIKQASIELGEAEDVLKHDLGRVLMKLEALQDGELASALKKDNRQALSEEERAEALALLRDPNLMARIAADVGACGIVGEETNKLAAYLACVSRLLDRPLAVIIQSSSAAGKSSLMDAVLSLMPLEAQLRYSAMTGQSLFYMGATNLKHRILAIAEEEGAESASYALKLLQSDGEVTIASTGKDPVTGLLVTHEYRVEGPVMLFLTTTAIDLDEELLNRCLVLSVNESREQTRAIHKLQRKRQTLAGLLADEDRAAIQKLHTNAQGLLERLAVVNPFAESLSFLDGKTRTRRDHMKYLTLIRVIALVHQHQRDVKTVAHRGRPVRYVEATIADIALANRLAHEILGRTLDELPPQTRTLLNALDSWVRAQCDARSVRRGDFRFTRRDVRALTGWGDTQAKVHLARLAELEYVLVHRLAPRFDYELIYDGEGESGERFALGLCDVLGESEGKSCSYDENRSGQNDARSGPGRPPVGGRAIAFG
jgi:DNA primase